MYFLLAAVVEKFYLLKYGLALILTFIGVKMLGEAFFHIDILISLAVVLGTLFLSIAASMIWPKPEEVPEVLRPEGKTGSIFGTVFTRKKKRG
jgi:tellurite resistance protein TerC